MLSPTDLREKYDSCYLSEAPDGLLIPWKPLSVGDFLKYRDIFREKLFAPSIIETEIFCKCVLDKILVKNIDKQKAGTITFVVAGILEASGPVSLNEFNNRLNYSRQLCASSPLHSAVSIIMQAFPGCGPEYLYSLDYETLMIRLAQAEERLLKLNILSEPIVLEDKSQPIETKKKSKISNEDLKRLYEEQGIQVPDKSAENFKLKPGARPPGKFQEEIGNKNKPKQKNGQTIITKEQMSERFATGSDMEDKCLLEHQMIEDLSSIYPDYIKDIKQGKSPSIKTVEERAKEAKIRAETRSPVRKSIKTK